MTAGSSTPAGPTARRRRARRPAAGWVRSVQPPGRRGRPRTRRGLRRVDVELRRRSAGRGRVLPRNERTVQDAVLRGRLGCAEGLALFGGEGCHVDEADDVLRIGRGIGRSPRRRTSGRRRRRALRSARGRPRCTRSRRRFQRSGFAGAVTRMPLACNRVITPFQLDASANAPWTSTTVAVSVVVGSDMSAPFGRISAATGRPPAARW